MYFDRKSLTQPSGPLQVVPDIDDDDDDDATAPEPTRKTPEPASPAHAARKLSDFELKLLKVRREVPEAPEKEAPDAPQARAPEQPSIRRIGQDARPMSSSEVIASRHLLPPS